MMVMMAETLNFIKLSGCSGRATGAAATMVLKSTRCKSNATAYETSTAKISGIMRSMPLPQMLKKMIVAMATIANSQSVEALPMAEGAKVKPMEMMIGPVTTGGKKRITRSTPNL